MRNIISARVSIMNTEFDVRLKDQIKVGGSMSKTGVGD